MLLATSCALTRTSFRVFAITSYIALVVAASVRATSYFDVATTGLERLLLGLVDVRPGGCSLVAHRELVLDCGARPGGPRPGPGCAA